MTSNQPGEFDQVPRRDGPWVQAALFCERVLVEKDNVVSPIRVVDRWIIRPGLDSPAEMPLTTVNLTMFLAFKSGGARGSTPVRIVGEDPSGQSLPAIEFSVLFEGEDRGANVIAPASFQFSLVGLYWFDIYVEDQLMTRMPLRIVYERVSLAGQGTSG